MAGNPNPYKFTDDDNKTGGRNSGKSKLRLKRLDDFLSDYIDVPIDKTEEGDTQMMEDFMSLTPQQRLQFLMSFLPYRIPKLSSVDQTVDKVITVMSEEEKKTKIVELGQRIDKIAEAKK